MSERDLLLAHLRGARRHVLGALEGLSDADLGRPLLPSGWTPAGLVHHLAVDVERFWFRAVVAGEREAWASYGDDDPPAWTLPAGMAPGSALDLYRHEAALADAVVLGTPLATAPATWPEELFGDFRLDDLREVLLHVLVETTCHAGHLDAARELVDGRQWLVP